MMNFLVGVKNILDNKIWMAGLFLLCFILSWVGVYNSHPYDGPVWYAGYDALRLFTLSGNDFEVVQQWQWNGRNWLLLVMVWLDAVYLVLAVFSFFTQRLIRFVLSRSFAPSDKTIVVLGLGVWGLHYVEALLKSDFHVIAIEKKPSDQAVNELIKHRKEYGNRVALIEGDCFDKKVLDKAKVDSVGKVLPMLTDDASNIDMAYKIRKHINKIVGQGNKKGEPVILLAVDNIRLSTSLATYKRFSEHHGETEIRFFNIMQQAVVRHLMKHPPELYADIFGHDHVHFAIYGLGDFAINLIYVIAQIGHYRTWNMEDDAEKTASSRVKITIYDQKPEEDALADLKALFPNLDKVLGYNYKSSALMQINFNEELKDIAPVTQHIFCVNNETLAVRYATKLRKAQTLHSNANTPIFVRSLDGRGMACLIDSNCGEEEWPDNIFPLTILSENLGEDIYFDEKTEALAKVLNAPSDPESKWKEASSDFKHSSFFSAAFFPIRLRSVGYNIVSNNKQYTQPEKENSECTTSWDKQVKAHNSLAMLEHDRWKSERWLLGWNGTGREGRTLGDIASLHPELEAKGVNDHWSVNSTEWKQGKGGKWDIENVQNLPELVEAWNKLLDNDHSLFLSRQQTLAIIMPKAAFELDLKQGSVVMFNLMNDVVFQTIKEIKDMKIKGLKVIGFLPAPFEIIKALLPSMQEWDKKKLDAISGLSGKLDMYIEMPLQHPFSDWKKQPSLQALGWFNDACLLTDEYIRIRTANSSEELPGSKWDSRFLPKPGL